jgi:hypothetical protein
MNPIANWHRDELRLETDDRAFKRSNGHLSVEPHVGAASSSRLA